MQDEGAKALLKVSVSAIKTYEQCPRKYYYQYVQKLPKKDWEHLKIGNFVHEVLDKFHKEINANPGLDLAPALSRISKDTVVKFDLSKESKQKSAAMLRDYLDYIRTVGLPEVLASEEPFSIDLDAYTTIRGIIDRIDVVDDGKLAVLDYKAGKSKYLDEFQLQVYSMVIQKMRPDAEIFSGTYLMLSENMKKIPHVFDRNDLANAKNKVLEEADKIRTDQTWETRPSFLCKYCDFEEACPDAFSKASRSNSSATDPLVKIGRKIKLTEG